MVKGRNTHYCSSHMVAGLLFITKKHRDTYRVYELDEIAREMGQKVM
jgi:hypothetical protein